MWNPKVLVAPSVLSADPLRIGDEIRAMEKAGADWHHLDVMDGHFVPNLTFGPPLIKAIKKIATIPLDVHIMVNNPDDVVIQYLDAGANSLVFHSEACRHPHRLAETIRQRGASPGIALNPGTSLELAFAMAPHVDLIMLMSVNPGFGGQSFIPDSVRRVSRIFEWLKNHNLHEKVRIEVDGGINEQTGAQVVAAGASVLVAGTFIYGASDRAHAVQLLKN